MVRLCTARRTYIRDSMEEGDVHTREVPFYGLVEHYVELHQTFSSSSEFFIIVRGSNLTHVTTAELSSDGQILRFIVPGHDLIEAVSISPYVFLKNHFEVCGPESTLHYAKDVAEDIAEYLHANSHQLTPQSYLEVQKIFTKWTQTDEEQSFDDAALGGFNLLDERVTQALANLVYPPRWTDRQTAVDLNSCETLLHLAVRLRWDHLLRFIIHQSHGSRALSLTNQHAPLLKEGCQEMLGPAPLVGVRCVRSSDSGVLRICPKTKSLTFSAKNSPDSSHQSMILTLQEHRKGQATLKMVNVLEGSGEADQSEKEEHYNDTGFKKEHCFEDTSNVFEERLCLDTENDEEECPSSSSVTDHPLQLKADQFSEANAETNFKTNNKDTSMTQKLNCDVHFEISGVTWDSSKTDSVWNVEERPQPQLDPNVPLSSPSGHVSTSPPCPPCVETECVPMDNYELSPSLVAVEVHSEDDMEPVSPRSPFSPDDETNENKPFRTFTSISCARSQSASSCEHSSKEVNQDIRLRSYSYSSSKIGFRSAQRTRDVSPEQRGPSIAEQSHEKRIEEEELDKYNAPTKMESEKHKVIRTFSFLKNRMSTKSKSKKDREAKDRQLNGHRFSTGACLGPTVCVVCDKPAAGKDYLHCSVCTAIVHRGCKDSIPLCLKTFPNKYAVPMTRTKTASLPQNFTVRESPVQYIIPTSSILPSVTPEENKDSGAWTYSFQNTDRLNDQSEPESDPNQSEELLTAPLSSSSTDFGEDCVDAYIFKDILADAADYEAESWSSSVDHKFYKKQDKKAIKRQDVIYELMQTEIHHLQTLHVMAEVFRRGVKQEVQLEEEEVQRLFPCLDQLLLLHHGFFTLLKERRQNSAQPQGQTNYLIQRIGDVLLQQFSDENGKQMTHLYGEFCSHHNEAVSFFKELQLNNKKFQNFIKLQGNNSLVRRREIPECILLVTQRITKYPVLLERILLYTQAGTEEHSDITKALALIRGVITAVDLKVSKYEQQQKFQEVWTRMENRSSAKLKNGYLYRKHDMMRPGQTLSHQGILLWKSATGRLKDMLALLLTDSLIFLQEKDQKFVFAAVDQKPAVISLQKLIVREVANEERGMFLISASTAGPEMYEVHAASKEERNAWMRAIREAVESCPEEEQDYTSESEEEKRATEARIQKIHKLQESLTSFDHQICCSLEEKLQIYAELTTVKNKMEDAVFEPRLLVQNQEEPPQGSVLLAAALREAENLTTILSSKTRPNSSESDVDSVFTHLENPETLTETKKDVNSKVSQSVQGLTRLLYSLQAAVTLQDSWYEVQKLLMSENDRSSPRTHDRTHLSNPRTLQEQEKQRNLEKRKEEAATARRLREQLRKDRDRWERECKTRESQQEALERRLEEREKQCHLEAERLMREKEELQEQLKEYQQNLERLREGQRSVERERERLETQQSLIQRNQPMVTTHMVIPLDGQVPQMAQPLDPADNGSVFVNEAITSINNRLVYHRENDPSAHNCLNALLARSSSRRPPSARTHPETEHQDWGSSCFFSPAGGPDLERTAGDENTDMTWPSQTDSGGEESREETIVYL